MASTGIMSGDTNGLRASEVHPYGVDYADSAATLVAAESM
ncbi:MAG: hypothetical protein E5299_00871 [Burkholderia gladioli]|nr:MAG: hypothetical protein E5299_00871 [Burkholderia gladioli]